MHQHGDRDTFCIIPGVPDSAGREIPWPSTIENDRKQKIENPVRNGKNDPRPQHSLSMLQKLMMGVKRNLLPVLLVRFLMLFLPCS